MAEHARRRLREATVHLKHTVRDASLPHPVPTTLAEAEADALASVVDAIAASFPTTPDPGPATPHKPLQGDEEAAQEERCCSPRAAAPGRR
ncbi:hypothetical protein ACWEO4_13160 [Streptomyces sp. NPDC004393]